jgi:hypothetical protein
VAVIERVLTTQNSSPSRNPPAVALGASAPQSINSQKVLATLGRDR